MPNRRCVYRRCLAAALAAATLALLAAGPVTASPNSVMNTTAAAGPDIVGGQPAAQPYPFEASLLFDHGDGAGPRFHCGASLIARIGGLSWFETNGHCVTQDNPPSATPLPAAALRIGLGSTLRSQQTLYPVARVVVNPWWNWGATTGPDGQLGDIALVAVPVRVPEQPVRIGASWVGQQVTVIGWGLTTEDASGSLPDGLRQLTVIRINAGNCAGADPAITGGEFCIDNPGGTAGPCFGDSGSAALHHGLLVGSASRGVDNTCGTGPGIYTDVTDYLPWIASTVLGSGWAHGAPPTPAVMGQAATELAA